MTLKEALQDFLLACKADGLQPATVKWYKSLLQDLAAAFPEHALSDITPAMLRGYIVALRERQTRYSGALQRPRLNGGLSDDSIAGHVRALHRFWAWASVEYGLPVNPMANIKRPKLKFQRPKSVDVADIRRLIAATGNDLSGVRDRALLAFMMDTGCRVQGMINLRDEDLNLTERRALVTEKGDKTRLVFFKEYTATLLAVWLAVRPSSATTVFCNLSNNHHYGGALTLSGLHLILKRLKKKAGVTGRVNPHSFRHAFAREYIKNGGDLATLARLMGHSDVSVTANFYAVFLPDELADSHDNFSPVNDIDRKGEDE